MPAKISNAYRAVVGEGMTLGEAGVGAEAEAETEILAAGVISKRREGMGMISRSSLLCDVPHNSWLFDQSEVSTILSTLANQKLLIY